MIPEGFDYRLLLSPQEAAAELAALTEETPWEDHVFSMMGRTVPMPRRIAWYGDVAYAYSGVHHPARPFTPRIDALRLRVEAASGLAFNVVLLNLYRDGRDSMGWHSDHDYDAGGQPAIASLSLGATRTFQLRRKRDAVRAALPLESGSLLVMGAGTQLDWLHALPKVKAPVGPRLNLTFRHISAPVPPRAPGSPS